VVTRGEVWLARFDPTQSGMAPVERPCLIVSPPEIHDHLRLVLVAPMATGGRPAGFRVPVTFDGRDGLILLEQVRALDTRQLLRRLGSVEDDTLARSLATLREMFAE
jgi:mRNA interferase MazF